MDGKRAMGFSWQRDSAFRQLDRRARKTRAQLVAALMTLLREKPIDAITVRELTDVADVNRATFYSHYHDLYHMLSEVRVETGRMLNHLVLDHADEVRQDDFEPLVRDLYACVEENSDIFLAFFDGNAQGVDSIVNSLREGFLGIFAVGSPGSEGAGSSGKDSVVTAECSYRFDFVAGGLAVMIRDWLGRPNRESTETMIELSTNLVKDVARSHLG